MSCSLKNVKLSSANKYYDKETKFIIRLSLSLSQRDTCISISESGSVEVKVRTYLESIFRLFISPTIAEPSEACQLESWWFENEYT